MQLEVTMVENLSFGWEFIATIGGVIITIILFFNKIAGDLKRIDAKIEDSKIYLSEEHKRHDETLFKELTNMVKRLETHINKEEIESALQKECRKDIKRIRDKTDEIKCELERRD